MRELSAAEKAHFKKLNNPRKIQDYLDTLPFNFETGGDTLYSPVRVLQEKTAHCLEGALFAAAALWLHKQEPLLLDLVTTDNDDMHVVALFKERGYWGAISKTNHAVLRYRDPIYKTVRELALSYFHEYFLNKTGEKTLRSYATYNLKKCGTNWVSAAEDLWYIDKRLDSLRHTPLIPKGVVLRKAAAVERAAGRIIEYKP